MGEKFHLSQKLYFVILANHKPMKRFALVFVMAFPHYLYANFYRIFTRMYFETNITFLSIKSKDVFMKLKIQGDIECCVYWK